MVQVERRDWMLALLPFNLAMGPLSTLVTLEVVELKGGSVSVSYAMSAGTFAGIVASIIWGFAVDRYDRKLVLLLGLAGTSAFLALLSVASSIPAVVSFFAAASLFSSAVGISVSVLIMDTYDKRFWASAYSRYNYLSSVGYLAGDVVAAAAAPLLGIRRLALLTGAATLASLGWSAYAIPRSPIRFERESLLHMLEAFLLRLKLVPTFFLRLPSKTTFKPLRLLKLGRSPAAYVPLLYMGITSFYVSSGIFNTLYPYGLKVLGLTTSQVFIVISAGMAAQIAGFWLAPRLISMSGGNSRASFRSLVVRGSSYVAIGLSTALADSRDVLLLTGLTLYPLAAGIAFATFFTASNVMVFEVLKGTREGRGLGLYSSLTGASYFAGSLASGYIARYIGIGPTYVTAGALLAGSAYIFHELSQMSP
ncbi:MAG: MFS transporter [Acidilobus sp.]